MEEDQFSSSEEVDEEELEVALYSQIHFDPVVDSFAQTTKDFFPNFVQPSFQVGLKSFLSKKLKSKRVLDKKTDAKNSTVFGLNFISFSEDASKSEVDKNPENSQVKECSQEVFGTPQSGLGNVDCLILDHQQETTCVDTPSIIQQVEKKENKEADNVWSGFNDDDDSCLIVAVTAIDESKDLVSIIEPEDKDQPSVSNKATVSNDPGIGGKPVASNEPAARDKPAVGSKPAISNETGVRAKPAVRDACLNKVKTKGSQKNKTRSADTISRQNMPAQSKNVPHEPMPAGLFSFSITKTPRNVATSSPTTQEKCAAEMKAKSKEKRTQKSMTTEPTRKGPKITKLAEFLSISCEKTADDIAKEAKKKRVSKQEAAVQPRKPPVVLKRAPTVVVKYHQDSDTNTDYSESEESNTFSPVKVPKKSDTSKSSSVKIPQKLNLQPDSGDSSSDEEGEIVEEKEKPSTNFETRKKDVEVADVIPSEHESEEEEDKETKDVNEVDPDSDSGEVKSSSETSSSSDEDDDIDVESGLISQSGLDFNLKGGMEALLKAPDKDSGDEKKWSIVDQDRAGPVKSMMNRYFNPKKVKCRNCDQEGHLAVSCTQEKKIVCIMCGVKGHHYAKCPDAICYNCNITGHRSMDCPKPKRDRWQECERCWMKGHSKDDCPDLWRQYHRTVGLDSESIFKSKEKKNPKIFCFNCGRKGHLGYECRGERIDRFIQPPYPFVAQYDKMTIKSDKRDPDTAKRNKHKERRNERDVVGRKRKAEKSDDWDRKVSKRVKGDTHCMSNVDNLNIRIEQHQSSSHRASDKTASRSRKDKAKSSKDRTESFVSGSTVFQYQEPSDPKFSSQGQSQPIKQPTAHQFQYPMDSDFIDDQFEHSMERYSDMNHFNPTQGDGQKIPKSKSRKAKQKRRKQFEDKELMEDMSRHQVSHNEWWNGDVEYQQDFEVPEMPDRKNKHVKKNLKRKRKNDSFSPSPSTSYAEASSFSHQSRDNFFHAAASREQYEYPHHRPYHHNHQHYSHQQFRRQDDYAEDYISLNSRLSRNWPNNPPYQGNKKKRKEMSRGRRNTGNNGFRAREWVRSLY